MHFGHQTRRWNPKMAKYIFTERNGIYIIDLQKTKKLEEIDNYVRDLHRRRERLYLLERRNRRKIRSGKRRNVAECFTSTNGGWAER